jgi:hypothetical protein
MAHSAHAPQTVEIMVMSVSNEVHFTLEAGRVLPPYVASHSTGVTEIYHMALHMHALQTMQVSLKPFSNEGEFTFEAEIISRPYLPHALQWAD